jgi:anthranilate synthase component II
VRILILDNYDSFTYNLAHLVEKVSDIKPEVHLNDQIEIQEVNTFDKIILSPGPGLPKNSGILCDVIQKYAEKKNILGVCLGHQAIVEVFGGKLKNLNQVYHGIATPITVTDSSNPLFHEIPSQFNVGRYHSWVADETNFPEKLQICAVDGNNSVMALRHKEFSLFGVQFHPESILSEFGETLLRNWIKL